MQLLVYEFVTAGGWLHVSHDPPSGSLLAEGQAMRDALVADLLAIPGMAVDVLHDARLPVPAIAQADRAKLNIHAVERGGAELGALEELAAAASGVILIAPEFDQHLLTRARRVERAGGRLLSPSSQVVALTTDKHRTAEHLARAGVPVPRGRSLESGESLPAEFGYPAVLKPRDGAGSQGIEWLPRYAPERVPIGRRSRLEAYCPGLAASVACLCGPGEILPLEPCAQHLAGDGDFSYLGGSLPLEPALAGRARRLALRAVRTLPEPRGYVGVDLVLGADPAGSGDVVIEINPRLTTSYVGLRAGYEGNLAAALLAVAQGVPAELCWKTESIQFSSSGTCGRSLAGD